MTKKNSITILTVLLVLQAALIAYLYRPGQNQAAPSVTLMDSLEAGTVSSLTITDENASTVTLEKLGTGWVVGKEKYPADASNVENIINKINGLQSARLVSRTKSSHNRLKVGDQIFNRKVELVSEKGITTFFMGTAPSSKSVHLRVAGQNEVYQVAGISAWELQPEKDSWWKTKYVKIELDSLQSVTIDNAKGTLNLKRDAETKKWQVGDESAEELDQEKVTTLISAISNISISEYLPQDFTIDTKPVCTIDYLADNKSISLQIWPKSEDNDDHVVKLSTASFFAKVRAYIINDALDADLQSLLAEEPVQEASPAPDGE